jgi:cytochrome c oxidase subunit 4
VEILLNFVVLVGMFAVGLAFVVLLPLVSMVLVAVFSTVFLEQGFSWWRGEESDSVQHTPTSGVVDPPRVEDPHNPPAYRYVLIYLALVFLTLVTVGVSSLQLHPKDAVIAATVIALCKATLVVGWFMHLRHGPGMYKLALATSIFFMVVFFSLTMADVGTRDWGLEEQDYRQHMDDSFEAKRTPSGWSRRTDKP